MKYTLHLKCSKLYLLEIYIKFFEKLSKNLKFNLKIQMLPKTISKIALYKSPHVYKKAKDHYEIRYYQAVFCIDNLTNLNIIKKILVNKPIELMCKIQMVI